LPEGVGVVEGVATVLRGVAHQAMLRLPTGLNQASICSMLATTRSLFFVTSPTSTGSGSFDSKNTATAARYCCADRSPSGMVAAWFKLLVPNEFGFPLTSH